MSMPITVTPKALFCKITIAPSHNINTQTEMIYSKDYDVYADLKQQTM